MNYLYRCPECGSQSVRQMTISEYVNGNKDILCFHPQENGSRDGYSVEMKRVYAPVKVQFRGKGFTGAGGTIPKMDKNARVKDLAEKTDVENI